MIHIKHKVSDVAEKPDTLKAALLPGKRKPACAEDLRHLLNFREITQ